MHTYTRKQCTHQLWPSAASDEALPCFTRFVYTYAYTHTRTAHKRQTACPVCAASMFTHTHAHTACTQCLVGTPDRSTTHLMMSGSANRLYRKGCTSSSVSGPPRFSSSTPTCVWECVRACVRGREWPPHVRARVSDHTTAKHVQLHDIKQQVFLCATLHFPCCPDLPYLWPSSCWASLPSASSPACCCLGWSPTPWPAPAACWAGRR